MPHFANDCGGAARAFTRTRGDANPFAGISVDLSASPAFADVDKDDHIDLLIGDLYGALHYFRNDGGASFTLITGTQNPFDGISAVGSLCPLGTQATSKQDACEKRVAGKYTPRVGASCENCAPGKYILGRMVECAQCAANQFSRAGSAACSDCPQNQVSDEHGNGTCVRDWIYGPDRQCEACPPSAFCNESRVRAAKPGFWLAGAASPYDPPLPCPFGGSACLGENACADGLTGTACTVCAEGWVPDGAACAQCESKAGWAIVLLCVVATLCAAAWPPLAVFMLGSRRAPGVPSGEAPEHDDRIGAAALAAHCGCLRFFPKGFLKSALNAAKPFVLMAQVLSIWTTNLYLSYPELLALPDLGIFHDAMRALAAIADVVSIDVIQWGSLSCYAPTETHLAAVIGALFALMSVFVSSLLVTIVVFADGPRGRRTALFSQVASPAYFICSYLSYAPLCSLVVKYLPIKGATFDCSLEHLVGCRLRIDYGVGLGDAQYVSWGKASAIVGCGLICVGVPMSYVLLMAKHRRYISPPREPEETDEQLMNRRNGLANEKPEVAALSSLFSQLRPKFWYFEVINLLRQFVLNGALIMLGATASAHMLLSITVLGAHTSLIYFLQPYHDQVNNRLHFICSLDLAFTFACQLTMLPSGGSLGADPQAVAFQANILAITICVGTAGAAVFTGYAMVLEGQKSWQAIGGVVGRPGGDGGQS